MQLDTTTLIVGGSFVAALSGLLLAAARTQTPAPALLWWAVADFIYSAGIVFSAFHPQLGEIPTEAMGLALISVSPVLVWAGFRRFNHHRQPLFVLLISVAVFLATAATADDSTPGNATLVSFAPWVLFLALSIVELWNGRADGLNARWPLAGFLLANALVFSFGVAEVLSGTYQSGRAPEPSSWFGVIYFEGLAYLVGTALFMVLLCRERSERHNVQAARQDPLTGTANRGAFLEGAQRLLQRAQSDGTSFSLIMFDLDEFKSVNDTFGHDVGDAVIRVFVQTARSMLRPSDLIGRYGGEEFVVALPKATVEAAYVIAERIRYAFATATLVIDGKAVPATASGGVAAATSNSSVDSIMRAADQALYRAKRLGRNRVERVREEPAAQEDENIVRIA